VKWKGFCAQWRSLLTYIWHEIQFSKTYSSLFSELTGIGVLKSVFVQSESAQGEGAANAMAGRGRGGMAMRGRGGRGMRRR
jgi:hypothetical protein